MKSRLQLVDLHRAFILILFLSPLLFGTVEIWSVVIMELFIFFIFLLWLRKSGNGSKIKIIETPILLPLLLILFGGIFYLLPLPLFLIKVISPSAYDVYNNAILAGDNLFTISLYPYGTFLELIKFFTYFLAFFLTLQLFFKKKELFSLVKALMVIGTVIALIGIFQMIFNNGKLLWIRELRHGGTPFGPYVNRNHFAGLMEMLIPLSIAMLIRSSPPFSLKNGLRFGLSEFLRHDKANIFILSLTSVVIMITALFLSLSRGGVIGLSASMLLFGLMLIARDSTKEKGVFIILISAIILFSVGWFGWGKIIERFESLRGADPSSEIRLQNWRDSLRIIRDFSPTGTGPGTYEQVYPAYKTIPSQEIWEHAHNDYIEGAVEMGVIVVAIALYLIFRFYRLMFTGLRKRNLLDARLLGIGGMTGLTGILIHSITDFNLHVGANGLYFFVVSAIAIASINVKPWEEKGTLLLEKNLPKYLKAPFYVVTTVIMVVILLIMIAEIYNASTSGSLRDEKGVLLKKKETLSLAIRLNPINAQLYFKRGNISSALGMVGDALRDYKRAVSLNPLNGEYLQMLGLTFDRKSQMDIAEEYFDRSIKNNPTSAWLRKNHALWLFSKGKKEEAVREMMTAINLDPSNTRLYLVGLILSGYSPDQIKDVIPENYLSQLYYGRFREERGEIDEALSAYMNAFSLMKKDGIVRTEVYLRIGRIYEKKEMLKEALSIYEDGVIQKPDDYSLRLSLARVYDKLGLTNKAEEEYEKSLVLNPTNQYAQQRLKRLRGERR